MQYFTPAALKLILSLSMPLDVRPSKDTPLMPSKDCRYLPGSKIGENVLGCVDRYQCELGKIMCSWIVLSRAKHAMLCCVECEEVRSVLQNFVRLILSAYSIVGL
jgi:hypothetical protein